MSWKGNKSKVFTCSMDKYDELTEKYHEYFPSKNVLFMISAAVGISMDKKVPLTDVGRIELTNTYSINKDEALELLMEGRYPDITPEQRLEILEQFAESGIVYIYDYVKDKGRFDYERFIN